METIFLAMTLLGGDPGAGQSTATNKNMPAKFVVVSKLAHREHHAPAVESKLPAERFTADSGITYEKGKDGKFRPVASTPAVVPSTTKSGGCGCTASANCGASFCKSHGGGGCPASCPVKGGK